MGKIKLELSFYIKAHIYNFILVHYYIMQVGMNTHPSCKEAELGVSKQHEAENTQARISCSLPVYSPLQTSASPAVLWWSVGSSSPLPLFKNQLSFLLASWLASEDV